MGFPIKREDITFELAKRIGEECYVVEDLSYMQIQKHAKPLTLRVYNSSDTHFTVPYFTALKYGFTHAEFPWYIIQPFIHTQSSTNHVYDLDYDSPLYRPFVGELRDYQVEIYDELLEQLKTHSTTTVGLPPGWGKTMAAIRLGLRLGLRMIVIIPLAKVMDSWIPSVEKFAPNFKYWVASNNSECPEDVDIILTMDGQFKHIPKEIIATVGTVIVDEAHILCTSSRISMFLELVPKYVILESATLKKNNGFHRIAELIAGTHGVFRISTNPYNVFLVKTEIREKEERSKTGEVISAKLRKNLVNNTFRQRIMLYMIMNLSDYHKIMCIRMVKASIPEFTQQIRNCGITADSMYGFKGNYQNSQVLVGTQQKMGTGFDESNACMDFYKNPVKSDVIFFENTTPDEGIFEQARGRIMRSNFPTVYILVDENASAKRHVRELMPWFRLTNATVREISYRDVTRPELPQIFMRSYVDMKFYAVITQEQFDFFREMSILNIDVRLYESIEQLSTENSTGIILELRYINASRRFVGDRVEYMSICPICSYHLINCFSF